MKQLFLLAAMLFSVATFAQSDYEISKDDETGAVVLKGQISFDDLKKESSFTWMSKGAASYKPAKSDIKYLKEYLPQYEMVVLMGTWCDDSQRLIPELYKVLMAAGYPTGKVKMYGVNRAKEAKNLEQKIYSLEKVPTIIIYKDHTEIGRIVEHLKDTMEGDLVALISNSVSEDTGDKK